MTEPDTGPVLRRFETDATDERMLARVRQVSAGVASLCAVLVLLSSVPFAIALVCVLALLVSLGWLASARAATRRAVTPELFSLTLYARGLYLSEGAKKTWLAWKDVQGIHVDEERLDIVLDTAGEQPFRIEPRYKGIEIHALMDTMRTAWLDHASS